MDCEHRRIAEAGLTKLSALVAAPDEEGIRDLFASNVQMISQGHVYALDNYEAVLTLLCEIKRTFYGLSASSAKRDLMQTRFEAPDKIYSLYVTTWYCEDRVVAGPFSTLLVYQKENLGWKIRRIQISEAAPNPLTDCLAPYDAMMPDEQVWAAVENTLDKLSGAMLRCDYATFARHTRRGFVLQKDNGAEILETADDLRRNLEHVHQDLRRRNVTEVIRSAKQIHALGEDRAVAHCVTFLLSGTQLATPSYASTMCLEQGMDGVWAATSLANPRKLLPVRSRAPA